MIFKTVICDDLKEARDLLKLYLEKLNIQEVKVIGEAADTFKLIEICKSQKPDIILLDIELSGSNGVDAAKEIINILPNVSIVFITAHESLAIDSFEVYPVDYIMKPISIERLGRTLRKIIKDKSNNINLKQNNNIVVKSNRNRIVIEKSKIIFVERNARRTLIHTPNMTYETYEAINSIEKKLDSSIFMRTHKSYLINTNFTFYIKKQFGRTYRIIFDGYEKCASISREKVKRFDTST